MDKLITVDYYFNSENLIEICNILKNKIKEGIELPFYKHDKNRTDLLKEKLWIKNIEIKNQSIIFKHKNKDNKHIVEHDYILYFDDIDFDYSLIRTFNTFKKVQIYLCETVDFVLGCKKHPYIFTYFWEIKDFVEQNLKEKTRKIFTYG